MTWGVRRVLVTGGAGFIGSHLVERLVAGGAEVVVLDARTRAAVNYDLVWSTVAGVVVGDVRDYATVDLCAGDVDLVFHLAAESHVDASLADPGEAFSTNAVGTQNVALACVRHGVPLVYCSTDEVYGDLVDTPWATSGAVELVTPLAPSSPYSAGKAAGEMAVWAACRSLGLRAVVTRGSNAFGPRQVPEKLVPIAVRTLLAGRPVPVHGGGRQVRQWVHVAEFAEALDLAGRLALDLPVGRVECLNVAGPSRLSVVSLVRRLAEQVPTALPDRGPVSLPHVVAVPDRPGQDRCYHVSGERARVLLGFEATRSVESADELRQLVRDYAGSDATHVSEYTG